MDVSGRNSNHFRGTVRDALGGIVRGGKVTITRSGGASFSAYSDEQMQTALGTGTSVVVTADANGVVDFCLPNGTYTLTYGGSSPMMPAETVVVTEAPDPSSSATSALDVAKFGDGSDGDIVLDGTNTYSFLGKSGNVYNLTREIFANNLTIGAGITLKTVNYPGPNVKGTFTNNGTISNNGNSASGASAGATSTAAAYRSPGAGAAGGTGAGSAGSGWSTSVGGSGGAGGSGNGGANAGGGAGVAVAPSAVQTFPRHWPEATQMNLLKQGVLVEYLPGGGGGSGGGDGTNAGGGGGAAAGMMVIRAKTIVNNGLIQAIGGNGANGVGGNAGGGGGGGGGTIVLAYSTYTGTALTAAVATAGGTHGNGVGTGANGSDGAVGTVVDLGGV